MFEFAIIIVKKWFSVKQEFKSKSRIILQDVEGRMSLGKLKTYQAQSDRKRYVYIGLQE